MSNVITFRPRAVAPNVPPAPSPAETRRMIEEAAQTALDTADSLLAILDRMNADAEADDAGEAESAPMVAEQSGGQVASLRGDAVEGRPSALDNRPSGHTSRADRAPVRPAPVARRRQRRGGGWRGAA